MYRIFFQSVSDKFLAYAYCLCLHQFPIPYAENICVQLALRYMVIKVQDFFPSQVLYSF